MERDQDLKKNEVKKSKKSKKVKERYFWENQMIFFLSIGGFRNDFF